MLKRYVKGAARRLGLLPTQAEPVDIPPPSEPEVFSHQALVNRLAGIPFWEHKVTYYKELRYDPVSGDWLREGAASAVGPRADSSAPVKVNYGCGGTILDGWLNVDLHEMDHPNYRRVDLLKKHPFPDNSISIGYSEDMLEHLTQAQSIFLFAEILRTLRPGGTMRLSFPGLEGVLSRHYSPPTEDRVRHGEFEAYVFWDHIHFYSKEELILVATHLGFSTVEFFDWGVSRHPDLSGRETRAHQIDLNTCVELTK